MFHVAALKLGKSRRRGSGLRGPNALVQIERFPLIPLRFGIEPPERFRHIRLIRIFQVQPLFRLVQRPKSRVGLVAETGTEIDQSSCSAIKSRMGSRTGSTMRASAKGSALMIVSIVPPSLCREFRGGDGGRHRFGRNSRYHRLPATRVPPRSRPVSSLRLPLPSKPQCRRTSWRRSERCGTRASIKSKG
jgi:hypothetical protein